MTRRSIRPASERETLLTALRDDLISHLPAALALNAMGGFLWDLPTDRLFLDPGALAVFDLDPEDFDGRLTTLRERMLNEDLPGLAARRTAAFEESGSTGYGAYFRVRRSDGSTRWAHTQAAVQRDAAGTALRVVGIVRDASEELQHVTRQAALETDRKRRTDVVQALTTALSRALTTEDVVATVTSQEVLASLGALGASLNIVEKDNLGLRRLATTPTAGNVFRDLDYQRLDDPLPLTEVFRTQEPMFITREQTRDGYPVMWEYVRRTSLTAGALLPLTAQARPTGVLTFFYQDRRDFSPEERNLLLALAATVSQSLQRAVLYDEEHAMAIGLQQAMLPAGIPGLAGLELAVRYRPARTGRQIGGDWYDVVPLPGGHVGLVVGDVEGHDIHAAAVMGQLRTALRAYAAEGHPPATLLHKASVFLRDLDTERLATCIYVDLDPSSGSARIVRAGHPGPLVRHADSRCSRPAVEGGLPLGLPEYQVVPYPVTHIRLGPDDIFMLCTDGLLEFRGMGLEAGERQIEAILSHGPTDLDQMAEHIVGTIEARQGQEDDVALLLAAVTGI